MKTKDGSTPAREAHSSVLVVSVTWGKSNNYAPAGNEPFVWDGSLSVANGTVASLDHLHYKFFKWVQAVEVAERIFDRSWHALLKTGAPDLSWRSSVVPGDPGGLEGIRFRLRGDAATLVTLSMAPITIQFSLGELMEREHLRYHAGGKYSGVPVDVFLGLDARPRVSRNMFLAELEARRGTGWAILPEDWRNAAPCCEHSLHGARVDPGCTTQTAFPVAWRSGRRQGDCLVRFQVAALLDPEASAASRWMELEVRIGKTVQNIRHLFTTRGHLMKLEDLFMTLPWREIKREGNALSIRNADDRCPLLVHRVYIGAVRTSHREALGTLPPLPAEPRLWIGYDTNLLTPQNGEMDQLLQRMHEEELGNYVLFRERGGEGTDEDYDRWCAKLAACNFKASSCSVPSACVRKLSTRLGARYLGSHEHEISNLVYGWGDAEPAETRRQRTLPECQDFYLKRMAPCTITGQAIPMHHLDYAAGVEVIMTEIPASHATLCLASARGAAHAFGKTFWGVHAANHVSRCPLDEDAQRRHFVLLNQSWLCGAKLIYDEEVALYYNHDTSYSFSDPIPLARRSQYQALYHYGSAIELGTPQVRKGFLQGNYDCLIGGVQALPYIPPTKVWGMIGPETMAWEFNTPERGWKLLDTFMPGVWLYPVKQDPRGIRQFFSGTPHGQVDLVPVTADAETLGQYDLLVLPGWNTMTEPIHRNLLAYVQGGGHLVLCAAQCTEQVSRDFLVEKRDFRFFRKGDLRELAGVRLGAPEGIVNAIRFADGAVDACPGVPGLKTELCGAQAIAVDASGHPVLVEHIAGKGRVWMLTVGEYWGHPALDEFHGELGRRLVAEHPRNPRLSGSASDVDFHCFQYGDAQRVVLLNTDWTSPGNVKAVVLHTDAAAIPIKVREGRLAQVLLKDDVAVAFETLPVIVDQLRCSRAGATFQVGGAGKAQVRIFTPRTVRSIRVDGQEHPLRDGVLELDFGTPWTQRQVRISTWTD